MLKLLKRLVVPVVLAAGLYVGYTGDLGSLGRYLDEPLGRADQLAFQATRFPAVFLIFAGLALAWIIQLLLQGLELGRRRRAIDALGEIWERGARLKNEFKDGHSPTLQEIERISRLERAMYANATVVSQGELAMLRTINSLNLDDHPESIHSIPIVLHFSERLRRLGNFLGKHSKAD